MSAFGAQGTGKERERARAMSHNATRCLRPEGCACIAGPALGSAVADKAPFWYLADIWILVERAS